MAHTPKSNLQYWAPKLERNRSRDLKSVEKLAVLGWKVLVVWECQTKDLSRLRKKLSRFLNP